MMLDSESKLGRDCGSDMGKTKIWKADTKGI